MYLLPKNKKLSTFFLFALLSVLLIPAFVAFFHPGFFSTDDGNWMVIRFSAFYESLRQGQFPPRFLLRLNNGYGYPVADFLYPLFMYLGIPLHILGVNFVNTIKIILGASLLFSGFFTYLWLKKQVRLVAAITGSLLYVIFPYHLFDVYQRGSVGEVLALAIVPFILWQVEKENSLITAIGIALLILAHNSLAFLFLPVILMYMFVRKSFSYKRIGVVLLLSLGLSAFFWIPALYDKQFTVFDKTIISSLQPYFINGTNYFLLGWISLFVIVLSLPLFFMQSKVKFLYFWLVTIISIFFTLPFSNGIWQITHMGPFFQFPYRFLSLTMLGIAFLSAIEIEFLQNKARIVLVILLIVVGYLSTWNLLFPKKFQEYPDAFYSTNQDSTTVKNEYMPQWVKKQPVAYTREKFSFIKGEGRIIDVTVKGGSVTSDVVLTKPSILQLHVVYFPGWEVLVDGKKIFISYNNDFGFMQFPVAIGGHSIVARFVETPMRLFADIISIMSICLLVILFRKKYGKK